MEKTFHFDVYLGDSVYMNSRGKILKHIITSICIDKDGTTYHAYGEDGYGRLSIPESWIGVKYFLNEEDAINIPVFIMEWANLTNAAKNVIEWVEDPFTNKRRTLEIKVGEVFAPHKDVEILITRELYQEIIKYVSQDKELHCEQFSDSFMFKLRDDSKLILH